MTLTEAYNNKDELNFGKALRQLAMAGEATLAEAKILQAVARIDGPIFSEYHQSNFSMACKKVLALSGYGSFLNTSEIKGEALKQSKVPLFSHSTLPNTILILVAVNSPEMRECLVGVWEATNRWWIRLACEYRLSKAENTETAKIVGEFRSWILNSSCPSIQNQIHAWNDWRNLMQCLTLEGMRAMMRSGKMMFDAPSPSQSPLIKWAIEQNHHRWLFDQMQWIDAGGTECGRDIRNGLVACGYEPAVKQCCEQIIQADFEAHVHDDIITSALQLHPKPLPELVLRAMVHAVKYPCHPSHYKHRCLALNLMGEAVMTGHPMSQELKALIRETAHLDLDGDVKAEARRLLEL